MHLSRLGARRREGAVKRLSGGEAPDGARSPRMVTFGSSGSQIYSAVKLGGCVRLSLMLTPASRGSIAEQTGELLGSLRRIVDEQKFPAAIITQTVFLRDPSDRRGCEQVLADYYGAVQPVTNFVLQPPCYGAALALEAV